MIRKLIALTSAALVIGAHAALAQTGGGYDLTWNTTDGGGVTFATGGAYSLGATVGQADAGTATGGAYTLNGGFWYDSQIRVFVPSTRRDSSNAW